MRGSSLGLLSSFFLLATGCHDLDALSTEADSGSGGTSGFSGSGGSGGGGSGGSGGGGSGGAGGGGIGGSGGSGGSGDLFCNSQRCADLYNPLDGDLCCTEVGTGVVGDNLELAGRDEDECGVRLDSVDPGFDATCWQLAQPGSFDSDCPDYDSTAYGNVPGCCTEEGFCGLQLDALGFGCTYALNGVGHPCGSNPIEGCHPSDGPFCTSGVCKPVFIEDRQLSTWACVDPLTLPGGALGSGGLSQGSDCESGWVQASTSGGSVLSDPCQPGLVCVSEVKRYDGFSCQVYCDENLECGSYNERCHGYGDPSSLGVTLYSCDPTEDCSLGNGGFPIGTGCPGGEACYVSFDWFAMDAHDQCFTDMSASTPNGIGDECTDVNQDPTLTNAYANACPLNSVCIGPLGVDPNLWGDGDPAHAFRCTQVCQGPSVSITCPTTSCTSLDSWGMDAYDDITSRYSVSLCPLPTSGSGGTGGTGGSGGNGGTGGF